MSLQEEPVTNPFELLLVVQNHDTHLDQLRHRRAVLPVRERLRGLDRDLAALATETGAVQARRDDVSREQKRIEDEVSLVVEKAAEVDKTLYGGTVTSPRALQDLQADLESLQRRQRQLEDQVLELMESAEPLDAELATLAARKATLDADLDAARQELTVQEAEIDVEIDAVERERSSTSAGVGEELLGSYETLRAQLGGIGVARLEGGRCLGCQLQLSAVERDRIKGLAPDELVHCEECGRMLVH
jgi:predicted  nucleic acid-binding Zn-ribbon protein